MEPLEGRLEWEDLNGVLVPDGLISLEASGTVHYVSLLYFNHILAVIAVKSRSQARSREEALAPFVLSLEKTLSNWDTFFTLNTLPGRNYFFSDLRKLLSADRFEEDFAIVLFLGKEGSFFQSAGSTIILDEVEAFGSKSTGDFEAVKDTNFLSIFLPGARLSFFYHPEEDYYRRLEENYGLEEKWEECGQRTAPYLYRLDERGKKVYFWKGSMEKFGRKCGLVSRDSFHDCNVSGMVPSRMVTDLYRGGKKITASPPAPYYCRKQLLRDNPGYKLESSFRVQKEKERVKTPRGETIPLHEACEGGMECEKYYDPADIIFSKERNYRTPLWEEPLVSSFAPAKKISPGESDSYYEYYQNNKKAIYPFLVRMIMLNYNPEICVSILSEDISYRREIVYTQKISAATRLFVFYLNEEGNFGEEGHGSLFFVDIEARVASRVDSLTPGKTWNIMEKAEEYLSIRASLGPREVEKIDIPAGLGGDDETSRLEEFLRRFRAGEEHLDVKSMFWCPNVYSQGLQTRHRQVGCFLWAIVLLEKITASFEYLKRDRKYLLNAERDLTEGFFRFAGRASVGSFLAQMVEWAAALSREDLARARISEEEREIFFASVR